MSRLAALVTSLLALAAPTAAQSICHQENGGPDFLDGSFIGPNNAILAVPVVPAFTFAVTGIQVFSGEIAGPVQIAIWSHDPVLNQPGVRISSGSFTLAVPNGWQGGSLKTPVVLQAGTTYWAAWILPFRAQSALEPTKAVPGQPYRTSVTLGATWEGPFLFGTGHNKFKLLGECGPCTGYTTNVGTACAGPGGPMSLFGGGCPGANHRLVLRLGGGPALGGGVLTFGTGTGTATLLGQCLTQNLPLLPLALPLQLDASGALTLTTRLPAAIPAADLYAQAYFVDSSAPAGFVSPAPLHIRIE